MSAYASDVPVAKFHRGYGKISLSALPTPLADVCHEFDQSPAEGLTLSMLYAGVWLSFFANHTEDKV